MSNPFFQTEPIFLDSYVEVPTFLTSRYMRTVSAQRFLQAACCLGIQWVDYYICLTTSKNGYKNQRAVYEVNILDDPVDEWVRFFKGQVYECGRFRNTGSHTCTTINPVPAHTLPPTPSNEVFLIRMQMRKTILRERLPLKIHPFILLR